MHAETLITLGSLFLLGLLAEGLGRHTPLPRVTLLLLLGVAVGPHGVGLLPERWLAHFGWLSSLALTMVGFLLGGRLASLSLNGQARHVLRHAVVICLATFGVVFLLLWALGVPLLLALLLGAVALATDPAATLEVVAGKAERSHFAGVVLGIVAMTMRSGCCCSRCCWRRWSWALVMATVSPRYSARCANSVAPRCSAACSGWR